MNIRWSGLQPSPVPGKRRDRCHRATPQDHVQAGNIALLAQVILDWLGSIGRRATASTA
jgi:hypothetical protein